MQTLHPWQMPPSKMIPLMLTEHPELIIWACQWG